MFDALEDTVEEAYERKGLFAGSIAAFLCCIDALRASVEERTEMIARDLAYALRVLAKTPLFTAIVIGTLAFAIGANTAIFSVVNGVLLRPLPYAHAGRLVNLYESTEIGARSCTYCAFSLPDLRDVRARSRTFGDVAAYQSGGATVGSAGRAVSLSTVDVDEHYFPTLDVKPALGRLFTRSDTRRDAAPVVAFGERFWRSQFGGDPNIIGRFVKVEGVPTRVVGIVPASFIPPIAPFGTERYDAYSPIVDDAKNSRRGNHSYKVIGQLRPGAAVATAGADLQRVDAELREAYPADEDQRSFTIRTLRETLFGNITPALALLGAGALLLLLVACANVANLLLARAAARRYELTVRAAVGATAGRIVALLLAETLVLAALGGCGGIALATLAAHEFVAARPPGIPRLDEIRIDAASFAFTAAIVLAVTLLAGLAPALSIARGNLIEGLNARGRSGSDHGGDGARNAFVVFQTGFALALAVASGLVLQSFFRLSHTDPGFNPNGVAVAGARLASGDFKDRAAADPNILAMIARLRTGVAALPGVHSASLSWIVPFSGRESSTDFEIAGQTSQGAETDAAFNIVSPGYFTTFQIPLLTGRFFDTGDSATAQRVAIVSRSFARRYLGSKPIGHTILVGMNDASFLGRTIVGVVGDVRSESLANPPQPLMYIPLTQIPFDPDLWLAVNSPLPSSQLGVETDRIWDSLNPDLPPLAFDSMNSYVASETARAQLLAFLLLAISALAVLLAAAGIYSIVSYGVERRTHDIGIRMALGARPLLLVRSIVLRSIGLAAIGVAAGLVIVGAFGGALTTLLYDIAPTDLRTLALVALGLIAVALVASLFPAWRATRIDPLVALRYE